MEASTVLPRYLSQPLLSVFDASAPDAQEIAPQSDTQMTRQQILETVHNSVKGHWGVAETYM